MIDTNPTHFFRGMMYLDIINLEEKFYSSNPVSNFNNECFIDLSQVRFAELSTIAKLTLLIEVLLKRDSKIYIALPTIVLTDKEAKSSSYPEKVKNDVVKSRIKANNFIKTVGFINAIRYISHVYQTKIYISEHFRFETIFNPSAFEEAFSLSFEIRNVEYYDYKYIFPLEWIEAKKGIENFSFIEERIDKILENRERGLEQIDVKGIKNVIVSELIKNVCEHAETPYALLTIGLIDSKSLLSKRKNKKVNPVEKSYLDWLEKEEISSQVEIYFGDTGVGILSAQFKDKYLAENKSSTKQKDSELAWAFDKWSTRKNNELRRGTKGLYRIQRIVNKYSGIFHIITHDQDGGFKKGGVLKEEWISRKTKIYNEGTFVQIKLCPYREVKSFRFTLKDNISKVWKTVQYNPKTNINYLESFKEYIKFSDNLLVILNLNGFNDDDAKAILEKCLPEFSFYSHPTAVVVYVLSHLKNDTIQTLIESTNEYIIAKTGNEVFQELTDKDAEEIYDPVLVIGSDNQAFWYGGNQELIDLLNESYDNYFSNIKITQLNSYKKLENDLKVRIKLHLESDNKLVIIDKDQNLSFNFTSIDSLFDNQVRERVTNIELYKAKKFCSPKLEIIDNWINVYELLRDNDYGYALALYLRFKKEFKDYPTSNYYILIDHNQQKELAKALCSLLGINYKNIKVVTEDINPNIPRRTKLFPEGTNIIILTSIISSSETVRRLVKFVKRDLAHPLVILSLCNYRKYNIRKLETWNEMTSIISVFQQHIIDQEKNDRDENYFQEKGKNINQEYRYISPKYDEEKVINHKLSEASIEQSLRKHIIKQKALHFNHIGIFKDRHFTFYLDKRKVLKDKSIIWERINQSITEWKNRNKISFFSIYIPNSIIDSKDYYKDFINFLESISEFVYVVHTEIETITDKNVVFIDFGVISGKTINNVIKKCLQVQNLLICILFDQSQNKEFDFYKRINSLNNEFMVNPAPTNFHIEYLFSLPLRFYTSENCPVCEHTRALEYYKIKLKYMFVFSEDRQERLKLIDSHDINVAPYPFDFYYDSEHTDHELASELIIAMFEFRNLLELAETSTQWRIEVFNVLNDICTNIESYINESNSKIYSVIYYLSNEINWLQKEPLVFRDFREMLTLISYRVSTISLSDLSNRLSISNLSFTSSFKLAVRYKYSAITLLRSTNKLKFCQSISDIVCSSLFENKLSNNLLQNTYYHLLSIYKNKYNISKSYFNAISEQLQIIEQKNLSLNRDQSAVLEYLEKYNNIFYDASDLKIIKTLKKNYGKFYASRHPHPDNCMHSIDLSEFPEEGLQDLVINRDQSIYYSYFKELTKDIEENWIRVYNFIYNNIQVYTKDLSDEFKNSNFYKELFLDNVVKNIFDGNYLLGVSDEFSILISEIAYNPLAYLNRKAIYDSLHNKIYNNLIAIDSKFAKLFISQFPTDVISSIRLQFEPRFDKFFVQFDSNSHLIFYPTYKLKEDFLLIINNIEKRINEGLTFDDIQISASVTTEEANGIRYTMVCLRYDSTDKNNNTPNQGALFNMKKEIENFGGAFNFKTETDVNGLFTLNFKFLEYE